MVATSRPSALPANPSRRTDLPSLTGLRFIAALLVFFTHALLPYNPLDLTAPINPYANDLLALILTIVFAPAGPLGVSFFFVLSGFVLTWAHRPDDTTPGFWRRRLLKIFPNHLVMWVLSMALFAAAITPTAGWLANLFLVHAWSPDKDINSSVNIPSWSLSSELLFYLAFPFLIRPLRRIAENRLWWWAGGMVGGVAGVAVIAKLLVPPGPLLDPVPIPLNYLWFVYYLPAARIFEFVLGILLARIVLAGRWPRIGRLRLTLLCLFGYAGVIVTPTPFNFVLVTVIPVAAVIGTAASADLRGGPTMLSRPAMVWLGTVSFGFYIGQALPIFYGRHALFGGETYGAAAGTALLAGMFLATLLLGWLLHRFVEHPVMRRWGRHGPG